MIDPTVTPVVTQVTISGIMVAAIQWAKSSSWFPFLHATSDTANRWISIGLASLAAIGIHLTWNHGAMPGSYMIGVSGLTLIGVGTGTWAVVKSFVFQELIYRNTVKTQLPGKPAQVIGAGAVAAKGEK